MERRKFLEIASLSVVPVVASVPGQSFSSLKQNVTSTKKLFIYGGDFNEKFINYLASLTGKSNPKICFLPTATGDAAGYINRWFETCSSLNIRPFVQRMFISSYGQQKSFEEVLLDMDGIVVGGGNTLNMLSIWKAQGVNEILNRAWEKGIVLGGGSAGSLCWFEQGLTDSRPTNITKIEGLGFLKGSHCPHYNSEKDRKPLYHSFIMSKDFKAGYACDDLAGIYFEEDQVKKVISLNEEHNAYYVYQEAGQVKEKLLIKEVIK